MRKPKNTNKLKRKAPKRLPFKLILIVCEGSSTEPNYLKEVRRHYKLHTAAIEIYGEECGSAPCSIVDFAKEKSKESDYDHVYCVFDRDSHDSFTSAISQINDLDRSAKYPPFKAIVSNPCFEIWILLHFIYTTKVYVGTGSTSSCRLVIRDLKRNFPGYEKGADTIFSQIKNYQNDAIHRAERLADYIESCGATSPMTEMYLLINNLKELKSR